jgi:hypothetical protein
VKNSYLYILRSFYAALNGNVTVDGDTIPVYSGIPSNSISDYIYLGEHTSVDWGGGDMFGREETLTIQILSRENPDYPDKTRVNEIADQVLQILKPSFRTEMVLDNFEMVGMYLENQFNDYALGDNDSYNRIILVFKYLLQQVNTNWILATGFWNDDAVWIDTELWID